MERTRRRDGSRRPFVTMTSSDSDSIGGFSAAGLRQLHAVMAAHVQQHDVPGLVTAVWRRGELHVDALGHQLVGDTPIQRDTIFRIASLSKPVTAAAAMILVEECRVTLDGSVEPWLPELADRRVLRRLDAPLDDTVPARRAISLRDLLTLRFGLGAVMEFPPRYPIQRAMQDAELGPSAEIFSQGPDEFMRRLGSLPLVHQPGEGWLYHTGLDVAGVLIERVTGQALGEFMRERIFAPLGMKDTGFYVPMGELERFATAYRFDRANGALAVYDHARGGAFASPPLFASGGGGLVSTAEDYLAFCRMMLDNGKLGAERVLSRPSVELMTMNHLTAEQRRGAHARLFFGEHSGWGFGSAVALCRDNLWRTPRRFGWDGGYGTTAYTDPEEDLIGVLMTQRMMDSPEPPRVFTDFWTSVYRAMAD